MNRLAIDEDAGHEIASIYEIDKYRPFYRSLKEKEQKGTDQMISLWNSERYAVAIMAINTTIYQ